MNKIKEILLTVSLIVLGLYALAPILLITYAAIFHTDWLLWHWSLAAEGNNFLRIPTE
jgi:hypothetical protein